MVRGIGDVVEGPEAKNQTGADQGPAVSLGPIGHCLRRFGREPAPIENRYQSPESIGDNSPLMSDYIFYKK